MAPSPSAAAATFTAKCYVANFAGGTCGASAAYQFVAKGGGSFSAGAVRWNRYNVGCINFSKSE